MTYSATTWQTGDLITAVLLNNTESQYATYKQEYGPIRLTTGSTYIILNEFTTAYSCISTKALTKKPLLSFFVGNYLQPSNIDLSISYVQLNSAINTFGLYILYGYTSNENSTANEVFKQFTTPAFTSNYQTFTTQFYLYPGHYTFVYSMDYASTSLTHYIKDLTISGSSQAPWTSTSGSTGLAYISRTAST